jgi:hypothetical protein
MASDNKSTKADAAPKEAAAKAKSAAGEAKAEPAPKQEAAPKDKSAAGEAVTKADGGDTAAAAPSNYSRGEGQKPVTAAYKENWNAIFAKNKKKKPKKTATKHKR